MEPSGNSPHSHLDLGLHWAWTSPLTSLLLLADFSDRIGKTKRTGYESGDYEMLGEGLGVKETPQQKYQRLLHEVQELTAEVEKIKVTAGF